MFNNNSHPNIYSFIDIPTQRHSNRYMHANMKQIGYYKKNYTRKRHLF